MARWIGFCAPGRKPFAWLQVIGESVTQIYETETMRGSTDVILANLEAMDDLTRMAIESAVEMRPEVTAADLAAAHERMMADWIRRGGRPKEPDET